MEMRLSGRGFPISAVLPVFCILLLAAQGERPAAAATAEKTAEAARPKGPPPVAQAEKAVLTDRDGNGLSDGLQERLAGLPPTAPVDVVVTFSGRGDTEGARKAVGPFKVKEEFRIIPGFAATVTAAQARALARAQGVFRVEEDFQVSAMLDASRNDFGIDAVQGWSAGLDGTGMVICVVDTGVDAGHEQLDNGKVAAFTDFVGSRMDPYDDHGHGTHVAAIAAGHGTGSGNAGAFHGVAPAAWIYAAKVLDSTGSGSDSDVIAGVQWCAEQPDVDIISMSLGTTGSSDGQDSLSKAVNNAVGAGKVVVVAAGNSGDGLQSVGSPGAAEQAVTVGAAAEWSSPSGAPNHSDGVYLAPFSSRGPTADGRPKPDIVAPGVSVTSARAGTTSGYVTWSGTSMATPFVSGALALALQAHPGLSPGELKSILLSTARDRGPAGADNDWGAGLLDGAGLVAAAGSLAAGPTPFPKSERMTGTVPDSGEATFTFEITEADLGIPVAVAVTILDGGPVCLYGIPAYCDILGGWAWAPDLDAELTLPSGSVIASTCPLGNECGSMGRQETLHYLPVNSGGIGTYKLRIYPFADDADGAAGGRVAVDLSRGPLPAAGSNTPPVALGQSVSGPKNSPIGILLSASDAENDPLTYAVVQSPAHGALSGVAPALTYTPATDYVGSDSFTFTASDGIAASEPATVSITIVAAANQPPAVKIDKPADGTVFSSGSKITFTGSAGDAEDGDLTAALVWTSGLQGVIGTGGSFTLRGKKALRDGIHTITAAASDSGGSEGSAAIEITVGQAAPTVGGLMHVESLAGGKEIVNGRFWKALVHVRVYDGGDAPVENAKVSGDWGGGYTGSASCLTGPSGECTLTTRNIPLNSGSVTFSVTGMTHDTLSYDGTGDKAGSVTVEPPQ
jgi:serine protease AprX